MDRWLCRMYRTASVSVAAGKPGLATSVIGTSTMRPTGSKSRRGS